jgi:hypothetical protein
VKSSDNKVSLNENDIANAVKSCFLDEIKQGTSKFYKLNIPLFTASSGTIAILLTLYDLFHKKSRGNLTHIIFCTSLGTLFLSVIIAIALLLDQPFKISAEIDLFTEYNSLMKFLASKLKLWSIIWLNGTILGILSLFITMPFLLPSFFLLYLMNDILHGVYAD